MHKRTNPKIFARAKQLHRNMSPAEAQLWKHLRAHRMGKVHFRNHTCPGGRCQGHTIGNYIVDFSQRDAVLCAPRKKLIIELDGSQHLEQQAYDDERTKYLQSRGYRVLRFWNNDVMNNIEAVLKAIWNILNEEKGDEER
jgi:very-short-patch-repair endonuclease